MAIRGGVDGVYEVLVAVFSGEIEGVYLGFGELAILLAGGWGSDKMNG